MRRDFVIGIILAASAIPYGAAMMAAPVYFDFSRGTAFLFFWGGLIGTVILIGIAVAIAWRDESKALAEGHKRHMIPFIGMIVFGIAFVGCAGWYFWPSATPQVNAANVPAKTKFQLLIKGARAFPGKPFDRGGPNTGIEVGAKIWNLGAPSVVVAWELTVTPNDGGAPVRASWNKWTKTPQSLPGGDLEADTRDTNVGTTPQDGNLQFFAPLPIDKVVRAKTWTLTATDIFGDKASTDYDPSAEPQRTMKIPKAGSTNPPD